MTQTIQFRRGPGTFNPVLAVGEPGYNTATDEFKIGDGTTALDGLSPFARLTDITAELDGKVDKSAGGIVDLRQWPNIAKAQWKSNLGAVYTSGQNTLTNSVTPFTAADVGKICIVNPNHATEVYNRWMATITAVNGSGVATLDTAAPSSATNERIYWGFDVTTALNDALQDIAADYYTPKEAYLPGIYRLTQLVLPIGVTLRGAGWSVGAQGYQSGQQGTTLKQLPGAEKDFVVFETTAYSGQNWVGPCGLTDILLEGPEPNVTGYTPTIGSGLVLRNAAGDPAIALDGCRFSWIQSNYFPGNGFDLPGGGVPLVLDNWRALQNGGYGIDYTSATAAATQMVHLLNYTGDGNTLGAVRFRNVSEYGPVAITALKSEATPDSFRLVTPLGDSYQSEGVIFEDCDNTPVIINGISHIYANGTQGPGPAIVIRSATTKVPRIVFNAVAVRVTGAETGSTADAVTVRDEVNTVDVPRTTVAGVYPAAAALGYVSQPDSGNRLVVDNGSGYVEISGTGGDTNADMYLTPHGTGVVRAQGGLRVMTLSGSESPTNKHFDNTSDYTIRDDRLTLQDNSDTTKQAKFELSGITTATTRTYTVPDASTSLVGTDTAQTLTNKTLTTPKIAQIKDANGNVILDTSIAASAVNYLQIRNTATGGRAEIWAQGADTNIDIDIIPKGTGSVRANGLAIATLSAAQTMLNKTLTSPKVTSGNAPATASSAGTAGQVEWDSGYVYICTATNTWKRAALSTW